MQDYAQAVAGPILFAVLLGSMWVWTVVARHWLRGEAPIRFEPRMLVPWSGLDLVVLVFTFTACEVVAALIAQYWAFVSLAFGALAGGNVIDGVFTFLADEPAGAIAPAVLATATIARVIWLVFAVVYLVVRSGAYLDDFGFDGSRLRRDARLAGLVFLAAIVPVYAVQSFFVYALGIPSEHPILQLTEEQPSVWVLALATIAAVGVAPLFEEFVFRVVLQGWLEGQQARLRRLRDPGATARAGFAPIVIASALFAGLHIGHGPDPIALFVLSLFLGYAYRQTHRIGPPLLIHVGVNAVAMINLWVLFLTGG